MLNKNSIAAGILAGLPFPVLACLTSYFFRFNTYLLNKPALPYFIAIALNLAVIRYYFKHDAELTCRGIMLVTFGFMLMIFILKIQMIR